MRLTAEARRSIAQAYESGRLTKIIAYEHGISRTHVAIVARKEGAQPRTTGRQRRYRPTVQDGEVLRLFKSGLDTISIAARLGVDPYQAANDLARGRDQERGQ